MSINVPEMASPSQIEPPRPGGVLVVVSAVMLALCLVGAGSGLALVMARGDDYAYIFGFLLGSWSVWLGQLQYRATFRRCLLAAVTCRSSMWLSAAFMAWLLFGWFVKGPSTPLMGSILASLMAVFALSAWLQGNWIRELRGASYESRAKRPWSFSLRELLLSIAAVACFLGGFATINRALRPHRGEHLRLDQIAFPLPAEARDVAYYCVGWYDRAYAFTIDEPGFCQWAEERGCRYLHPAGEQDWQRHFTHLHLPEFDRAPLVIADGLTGNDAGTAGDGVHVAYDRKTQRGYYFFSAR